MRKILFIVSNFGISNMAFNTSIRKAVDGKWDMDFCTYKNLTIEVNYSSNGIHFEIEHKGIPLSKYDYIYIRNWINADQEIAAAVAAYCKYKNIPFDDEQLIHERHDGKLYQMCLFVQNSIAIPHTVFISTDQLLGKYKYLSERLGEKFVMKNSKLNRGEGNYLIKNREQFTSIVTTADKDTTFVCQEFIENEFEYRYLVLGGQTRVVMKRFKPNSSNSHKNNSHGMEVEYISDESQWQYKSIAENVAKLMRRDVVGVDILVSSLTGEFFLLEANPAPGMKIKTVEDRIKIKAFVEYIERQLK